MPLSGFSLSTQMDSAALVITQALFFYEIKWLSCCGQLSEQYFLKTGPKLCQLRLATIIIKPVNFHFCMVRFIEIFY